MERRQICCLWRVDIYQFSNSVIEMKSEDTIMSLKSECCQCQFISPQRLDVRRERIRVNWLK